MKTNFFLIALFLITLNSFSQQLTYKKGRIYDENNNKLSNTQVKDILILQPKLLEKYIAGNTKATVGGLLLGFGGGLVIADLLTGATQDKVYPSAMTFIGLTSMVISIPVVIGHRKKTKSAIEGYNESLKSKKVGFAIDQFDIISNSKGLGIQMTF